MCSRDEVGDRGREKGDEERGSKVCSVFPESGGSAVAVDGAKAYACWVEAGIYETVS